MALPSGSRTSWTSWWALTGSGIADVEQLAGFGVKLSTHLGVVRRADSGGGATD